MTKSKTVTESQADFSCIVCAQQVFAHFADRLGIAPDVALRTASCFGSGLGRADVCGCVTGALMVLGLAHGHGGACSRAEQRVCRPADASPPPLPRPITACFAGRFWAMTSPFPSSAP